MMIQVQRQVSSAFSTIGSLSLDGVTHFCFTLEPPRLSSTIGGVVCIPPGTYKVIIEPSLRFKRDMPRLLSVPGWPNDDVLIHWGNYPNDTEGCILVGMTYSDAVPDFIGDSRVAFDALFPKLLPPASAGDLAITIG
jgi:Steigviridae/Suoliviridae L,D-carboxypeptidase/transpeptidase